METVENLDQFIEIVSEFPYLDCEAPLGRDGWVIRWEGIAFREVEMGGNQWRKEPTSRMEVQGRLAFSRHMMREESNKELLRATAKQLIDSAEADQENQERNARRFEADALMALEAAAVEFVETGSRSPYLDNLIRYTLNTVGVERSVIQDALVKPLGRAEMGHLAKLKGPFWLIDQAAVWVDEAIAAMSDPIRGRLITAGDDELLSRGLLEAGRSRRDRSFDAHDLRAQVKMVADGIVRRDELILRCLRRGFTQKEVAEFSGLGQPRISLISREAGEGYTAPSRA